MADRGQAVVVGAGPAGCVMAMYLARQGFRVRVLEKRANPSEQGDITKSTFVIGLMPRGINPLLELGVRLPQNGWLGEVVSSKGSCIHAPDGSTRLRPAPQGNVLVERASLTAHLLQEARRLFPAIDFNFDADIQDIDLHSRTLQLHSGTAGNSSRQPVTWDLLVAADGAASQVREAVAAQEPGFSASREFSGVEYLVLQDLPPVADLEPEGAPGEEARGGRHVHMFLNQQPADGMRQPVIGFGGYVQQDGSYSAAIQFNKGWQPPASPAGVQPFLQAALPHMPEEWATIVAEQLAGATLRSWGSAVECSHLAVPWAGVMLIGDAAHSISPTMGQGCNAALETANQADKVLAAHPHDLTKALAEFDRVRKPDMKALRHIDRICGKWWGTGYLGKGGLFGAGGINWPYLGTMANILVSGTLNRLFPRWWNPPAMLTAFTATTTSYRQVLWRRNRDLCLLGAFVIFVVAVAAEAVKLLVSVM